MCIFSNLADGKINWEGFWESEALFNTSKKVVEVFLNSFMKNHYTHAH